LSRPTERVRWASLRAATTPAEPVEGAAQAARPAVLLPTDCRTSKPMRSASLARWPHSIGSRIETPQEFMDESCWKSGNARFVIEEAVGDDGLGYDFEVPRRAQATHPLPGPTPSRHPRSRRPLVGRPHAPLRVRMTKSWGRIRFAKIGAKHPPGLPKLMGTYSLDHLHRCRSEP